MSGPENAPVIHGEISVGTSSPQHHGVGLWPHPSSDRKDPLRWSQRTKILALLVTAIFNFVANFSGSALTVATAVLQAEFKQNANQINQVFTVSNLSNRLQIVQG